MQILCEPYDNAVSTSDFVVTNVHSISVLKMANKRKSEKRKVQTHSHLEFELFGINVHFMYQC